MHIKIFGMHIVIICSCDTANALMSQASYSDRPILTMVGKLYVLAPCSAEEAFAYVDDDHHLCCFPRMNFTPSIVLAPYGEHWKAMRRITQQSLNRTSSLAFLPSQLTDARLLLQELLIHPDNYIGAIR
jgi:hypothetical protein